MSTKQKYDEILEDFNSVNVAVEDVDLIESIDDESERRLYAGRIDYDEALKKQEHEQNTDVHNLRKQILPRLYILSVVWVVFVALFLVSSSNVFLQIFEASDAVLIALMTTTTTTVLGLFGIAAAWLFPKGK